MIIHRWNFNAGLCLGKHVWVHHNASERTILHESGHYMQWRKLRLLYWLVIAVPSFLHACAYAVAQKIVGHVPWNYYSFYTESWADRLGGINRG